MNATTTTDVSVKHPTATKIGKIVGQVFVPAAIVLGTSYVIVKTKNI